MTLRTIRLLVRAFADIVVAPSANARGVMDRPKGRVEGDDPSPNPY
jgi:hypothetical protein